MELNILDNCNRQVFQQNIDCLNDQPNAFAYSFRLYQVVKPFGADSYLSTVGVRPSFTLNCDSFLNIFGFTEAGEDRVDGFFFKLIVFCCACTGCVGCCVEFMPLFNCHRRYVAISTTVICLISFNKQIAIDISVVLCCPNCVLLH